MIASKDGKNVILRNEDPDRTFHLQIVNLKQLQIVGESGLEYRKKILRPAQCNPDLARMTLLPLLIVVI